jgi:23S rRNA pseudouridine1911/1915/1917 synthase
MVNGRIAAKDLRLSAEMEIRYELPADERAAQNPGLTLDIRLETESFVVVNKPAGQPSVALDAEDRSALANGLLARYPEMLHASDNPLEAGLVHRLDTGTSGLLLAARTPVAFRILQAALRQGQIEKQYVAIAANAGIEDAGEINLPLRPNPRTSRRMIVAQPGQRGAREALTRYQVVQKTERALVALVSAGPAKRHQIRAHFAAIGCPLLNDEQYGGERHSALAAGRHALHARRITWRGTRGVPAFDCVEPLPEDLLALLRGLGLQSAAEL